MREREGTVLQRRQLIAGMSAIAFAGVTGCAAPLQGKVRAGVSTGRA